MIDLQAVRNVAESLYAITSGGEESPLDGNDVDYVAEFVLTLTDPQPVTADWLDEVWGYKSPGTITIRLKTPAHGLELIWNKDDGFYFCTGAYQMDVYTERLAITTRGQATMLLLGLGCEMRGKVTAA